jgi:hypothetical protein
MMELLSTLLSILPLLKDLLDKSIEHVNKKKIKE